MFTVKPRKLKLYKNIWNPLIGKKNDNHIQTNQSFRFPTHDYLTRLPNREMFKDKLTEELLISKTFHQKLALLYINLDRFKMINESLGHIAGDELIKNVSARIKTILNKRHFTARMGGDEFAILLPNVTKYESPIKMAESIINLFAQSFHISGNEFQITTSIGISFFPSDGEDTETLIRNADCALSQAKYAGKNTYKIFTPEMNEESFKKFKLEQDLRLAILNNELELYYQPRVNSEGKILGTEALLRWNHPEWGIVSPGEFIPIAEETGLIMTIGKWVISSVCQQIQVWGEQEIPLIPVSMNLPPKQFAQNDLVEHIKNTLQETGIFPGLLDIEITENSLMDNEQQLIVTLKELNDMGVRISLDDFGTGYSSLSYLTKFKDFISTLKIDKSFFVNSTEDDYFIVKMIIQLAKQLKMKVIAEGIETFEQFEFLKTEKCDEIQGYLFSPPIPENKFTELLKEKKIHLSLPFEKKKISNERKDLRKPFSGSMTIVKVKEKNISLGKREVFIMEARLGRLRFITDIRMTVHPDILLKIETSNLGKNTSIYGNIVRLREVNSGFFEYDLKTIKPTIY